jgi:hypothetical protein
MIFVYFLSEIQKICKITKQVKIQLKKLLTKLHFSSEITNKVNFPYKFLFCFLYEDDERQWKKHSIFFAQYALKYYYSNSKSVFIFLTSLKLLENTFENTVTVIVRVIIEKVRVIFIPKKVGAIHVF